VVFVKKLLASLIAFGLSLPLAAQTTTIFNLFTYGRAQGTPGPGPGATYYAAHVGDLIYTKDTLGRMRPLPIGTSGQCLKVSVSLLPAWASCGGGGSSSPLTTKGDVWGFSSVDARLPVGSDGQVITADSGQTLGIKWATSLSSPLTTKGDVWGYSSVDARLPVGTNTYVLTADSAQTLGIKWAAAYADPLTTKGDILGFSSATARVPVGTNGDVLTSDSAQTLGLKWSTPAYLSGGTTNRVPYWTSSTALGNSALRYDSGSSRFGIGVTPSGGDPALRIDDTTNGVQLQLVGSTTGVFNGAKLDFVTTGPQEWAIGTGHGTAATDFALRDVTASATRLEVNASGVLKFNSPGLLLQAVPSSTTYFGLFSSGVTPSATNYALRNNGTNTVVNAATGGLVLLRVNDATASELVVSSTGIATAGGTPGGSFDIASDWGMRATTSTLSNGLNSNVSLTAKSSYLRVTGPTAAFSVGGFDGGYDGRVLFVRNVTAQNMTVKNVDASSTAANRIYTMQGTDIVLGSNQGSNAELIYESAIPGWILRGYSPIPTAGSTGGTGNVTTTGHFASVPSAGSAGGLSGDLYLPDDTIIGTMRSTGSAWEYWVDGWKMTDPALTTFAWANQGTSTIDTTFGGVRLVPQYTGGRSERMRVYAYPGSTPFTVTAAFMVMGPYQTPDWSGGIVLYDSVSTKSVVCSLYNWNASTINLAPNLSKYNTPGLGTRTIRRFRTANSTAPGA
jgi:hypothetical protein